MMHDLKLGLKMMRYAYGLKTNLTQAGILLLMGIVYNVLEQGIKSAYGSIFLISVAILPVQMIYSLNVSELVKTSPVRKRLQTSVPVLLHCGGVLAIYLAEVLLYGLRLLWEPELAREMCRNLITIAVMAVFMMLYMGVCYKYFVAASLFMVSFLAAWFMGGTALGAWLWEFLGRTDMAFAAAAILGLGIIALGGAAEYLLALLAYRAPLSKLSQPAPLRKWI